jgi:type VI secretion system protein VasD
MLVVAVVALAACADPPPIVIEKEPEAPPTIVELSIEASPDLNPDGSGRASPVVLGIYELRSPTQFLTADYFALTGQPAAALGADLVNSDQLGVGPGQTTKLTREIDDQSQQIGFVAGYRDLDKSDWRLIIPVAKEKTTPVTLILGPSGLSLGAP